ncbi:MAG: DUF3343 domain-containing protein [Clostridia bacterium]|nr:DUF3343 domain-containing protein [Clostridia bacterium]
MSYLIAVFRARSITLKAYNVLQAKGVVCSLVSTPQGAEVGCGLSIKFEQRDFDVVRQVCSTNTFVGFFRVTIINRKTVVTRII